jgi:N-acyl homoserine lactone hydrolase
MPGTDIGSLIKSVRVVSTGSGGQHKEHRFGSWKLALWWVLFSRSWIDIPINVFVIEHKDGIVLFDAGLDLAVSEDPDYFPGAAGRFFARRLFRLSMGPADTLTRKLAGIGVSVSDVCKLVVSHLHFDHVGGIKEIPQADLLVARDEWAHLSDPRSERGFFLRNHIEIPNAKWRQIDFAPTDDPVLESFGRCYDVMEDGSMVLLSTPGHSPGSLSMLVRGKARAPLLLVGDLTYDVDMLMGDKTPGTGDRAQLRESFAKVRALKRLLPDLIILPTHDLCAKVALEEAWPAGPV